MDFRNPLIETVIYPIRGADNDSRFEGCELSGYTGNTTFVRRAFVSLKNTKRL